jgi:hypothetical protein
MAKAGAKVDTPTKAAAKEIKAQKALKKQQKEDKPKVKRAPSPYIVFCTEKRSEAKDANPDATFGMLGKILGQMWGALDEAGKAVRHVANLFKKFLPQSILNKTNCDPVNLTSAIRESFCREKGCSRERLVA